jgi:hypothetical protein
MKAEEKDRILSTTKWIGVKRHEDDEGLTWEERYKILHDHHVAETTFLVDKVRELTETILTVEELTELAMHEFGVTWPQTESRLFFGVESVTLQQVFDFVETLADIQNTRRGDVDGTSRD